MFLDNFDGSGPLGSHAADTGETWTISTYRGTGEGADLVVGGGYLKRADYSVGTVWAYPGGTLTGGVHRIEFTIRFSAATVGAEFLIADTWSAEPGDNAIQVNIYKDAVYLRDVDYVAYAFADNTVYTVVVEFDGTSRRLLIDDVEVLAGTGDVILPPFLYGMYNGNDLGDAVQIGSLRVGEAAAPAAPSEGPGRSAAVHMASGHPPEVELGAQRIEVLMDSGKGVVS